MAILITLTFFVCGAVLASFAGVIAERLYTGESWLTGRSRCNSCTRLLNGLDLVPVLSWICSLGRCRTCRAPVPAVYALVEALLGICFVAAYGLVGLTLSLIPLLIALFVLLVIVLYDLRHTVVPTVLSNTFLVVALLYAYIRVLSPSMFGLTLLTAGATAFVFFLLHALSGGRVMGLGDAPMALGLSLLAGPLTTIPGVLFSFWIGAVVGIFILVGTPKGHRMGIEVPFVPFLAAGFLLALFTGWNPLLFPLF